MSINGYNSPVANNAKRIIKKRGLKQIAVAEKAGFSIQEFNAMLNGRRIMKAIEIEALIIALGIEANELFDKAS